MKKLEDKSNNEILLEIKQIEANYEALKLKLLKGWDELLEMEKQFEAASQIINKRLKGEIE